MGKVGQQHKYYKPLYGPSQGSNMERFVIRSQSATSNHPADPFSSMDPDLGTENALTSPLVNTQGPDSEPPSPHEILTPDILDAKLDAKLQLLLQRITSRGE